MTHPSRKRSASEPVDALLGHDEEAQPAALRRPTSLTLGAVFVFARALAGIMWIGGFALLWPEIRADVKVEADEESMVFWLIVGGAFVGVLVLVGLAVAMLRGSNVARVLVMVGLTFSTVTAAVGYFVGGEQITIRTTLLTVALDILVLLALSGRDVRAWSRQSDSARLKSKR